MNLNSNKNLFSRLASVLGIVSASFLLGLPALAHLQNEATSEHSPLTNGQLLSQSNNGDDGASDNGGSNNSDNDSGNNGSDNSDNSNSDNSDSGNSSASNSDDAGSSVGNSSRDDGDSGEAIGTRGDDSGGGAPYIGVGEPPSDNDSDSNVYR